MICCDGTPCPCVRSVGYPLPPGVKRCKIAHVECHVPQIVCPQEAGLSVGTLAVITRPMAACDCAYEAMVCRFGIGGTDCGTLDRRTCVACYATEYNNQYKYMRYWCRLAVISRSCPAFVPLS